MQATCAYRRNNKNTSPATESALAMDSNPCFEASNMKQNEAIKEVHVYEMVKQNK